MAAANLAVQPPIVQAPTPEELFRRSYDACDSYPTNLLYKPCSDNLLKTLGKKLDDRKKDIFAAENEVIVPMLELKADRSGWYRQYMKDDLQLQTRLGDELITPTNGPATRKFIKKDSKCRFYFISANANSRDTLKITPRMLTRLLSFHQVMPSFLDFIGVFGRQTKARHIQFSSFRDQDLVSRPPATLVLPSLDRSGRQFQMCYNLKSVRRDSENDPWSVVQTAAHHQFDVKTGNALWIFTQGHWDLKDRVNEMTTGAWRPGDYGLDFNTVPKCFESTLRTHLLFCEWSTENWNDYMAQVEDQLEQETDPALEGGKSPYNYSIKDLTKVQGHEEDANKILAHLESNNSVLKFLETFYADLEKNPDFGHQAQCHGDLQAFVRKIRETMNDATLQTRRAKLLIRIASYRKALILEHLQAQSTDRSRQLNESMFNFSVMAQRETIAMRVLAFVTMLYLPATFASTFFSTDVIKYQGDKMDTQGWAGTFSNVAMMRWLQVALPLTAVTGVFCVWYYQREKYNRDKKMKEMQVKYVV